MPATFPAWHSFCKSILSLYTVSLTPFQTSGTLQAASTAVQQHAPRLVLHNPHPTTPGSMISSPAMPVPTPVPSPPPPFWTMLEDEPDEVSLGFCVHRLLSNFLPLLGWFLLR